MVDADKLDSIKDYLTRAELTPEESGSLAGWLMLKGMGDGIAEALGKPT
jgi:hypothetical protein